MSRKLGLGGWGPWEQASPQRFPRGAREGRPGCSGPCQAGEILQHSSKQNWLGRGLLREWFCVNIIIDSERINAFMDKGGSV